MAYGLCMHCGDYHAPGRCSGSINIDGANRIYNAAASSPDWNAKCKDEIHAQVVKDLQAQLDAVTKRAESAEKERDELRAKLDILTPALRDYYHNGTFHDSDDDVSESVIRVWQALRRAIEETLTVESTVTVREVPKP